ncbi:AAA family ATPase [Croceicoccus sp. Ery15]|uniref:AAA family ATPase n=1 Tax=Croceicoccus sp. Ery15 TaxID=1703338 RepID=UPI001E541DCB|nr:AAA family ATPase [Croceicoccus sp. Ery15]
MDIITSRTGNTPLRFERINVLLGSNGTGKSKLLQELRGQIPNILPDHKIINIEGGRALTMYDSLELNAQNFNKYRSYDTTFSQYSKKRAGTLQSRLFDGLKTLELLAENSRIEHSDRVMEWLKVNPGRSADEVPRRPLDPMSRVFEAFNDIFPTITLQYSASDKRLRCNKGQHRYGPTSLSDGEKQVFSVLVDVVELAEEKSILFIDEPELNLHPGLANRLWSSIESMLPQSMFVYATHSVSFAMRDSVEYLYVLSNSNENIQQIDNLDELSKSEQEELLGNITSLLSNKKSLVVEGQDESFDSIFYNFILGDSEIAPSSVGGCEDVIAIVSRSGKWNRISPDVRVVGVVDRDYKSDAEIAEIEGPTLFVLEYHEAESYLCEPDLVRTLAERLGTVESIPSSDEISFKIISFVRQNKLQIVARRISSKLDTSKNPVILS